MGNIETVDSQSQQILLPTLLHHQLFFPASPTLAQQEWYNGHDSLKEQGYTNNDGTLKTGQLYHDSQLN